MGPAPGAAGSGDQPNYRSPAPSGQCGRRFTAVAPLRPIGKGWRNRPPGLASLPMGGGGTGRRMGPASFAQASADAKQRQETPCEGEGQGREAAGNAARSKGERGWSTVRKGDSRGKRASAPPGSPARGDRGRMGQQAKNDSFLPCWPRPREPAVCDRRREARATKIKAFPPGKATTALIKEKPKVFLPRQGQRTHRRQPKAEQGRFWDIRIPKAAAVSGFGPAYAPAPAAHQF